MRFVDEFRDAAKARALAAEIAALCEPGREYKFMEALRRRELFYGTQDLVDLVETFLAGL